VERARSRTPAFLSLAALCSAHIFRLSAQRCTTDKSSPGARAQRNHNKSLLLRRNWLRSAKPRVARPNAPACLHPIASPTEQGVGFPPAPHAPQAQRFTNPKPLPLFHEDGKFRSSHVMAVPESPNRELE
jgi:hypothetical protein